MLGEEGTEMCSLLQKPLPLCLDGCKVLCLGSLGGGLFFQFLCLQDSMMLSNVQELQTTQSQ